MSLCCGVVNMDPIRLPTINPENQSVKPGKSWQSRNTKYYKVLYFILKVWDLFQNCMVKPLIVAIKWKTSMHRIFNHKYTFLFISAYKNITIYSHVKMVYKIHKFSSYTHEESQLHICISDRSSLVCKLKSYIHCMNLHAG